MNTQYVFKQFLFLFAMLGLIVSLAHADKRRDDDRDRFDRDRPQQQERFDRRDKRSFQPPPRDYRIDRRYDHDRYYPKSGHSVIKLPDKHYSIRYHDRDYYFHSGIWYRPIGTRFVVIAPPIGIVVPFLPAFYTTIWFGGIPYYYANDVYYVWDPARDGYVVTNPPADIDEKQPPLVPDQLYIYPKQGQSPQKQADDRFACHQWSVKQTGYDPTQPPKDISQAEINANREDYQRAMRACLEGRGYSVR